MCLQVQQWFQAVDQDNSGQIDAKELGQVHCTQYTVHCSVYCTQYTVHCILYTVHCILYTVH